MIVHEELDSLGVTAAACCCGRIHFRNHQGEVDLKTPPRGLVEGYDFDRGPDGIVYVRASFLVGIVEAWF